VGSSPALAAKVRYALKTYEKTYRLPLTATFQHYAFSALRTIFHKSFHPSLSEPENFGGVRLKEILRDGYRYRGHELWGDWDNSGCDTQKRLLSEIGNTVEILKLCKLLWDNEKDDIIDKIIGQTHIREERRFSLIRRPSSKGEQWISVLEDFSSSTVPEYIRRHRIIKATLAHSNRKERRPTASIFLNEVEKSQKNSLAPIFEGQLDREAMAEALKAAIENRGLSVRKAASRADVSASVISQIKAKEASLDQAAKVLQALGYTIELTISPNDPEDGPS